MLIAPSRAQWTKPEVAAPLRHVAFQPVSTEWHFAESRRQSFTRSRDGWGYRDPKLLLRPLR
jgi:hypothetical protein